jgi:formylglycine-generating enzyme required for sulfatase activity
MHGNVWEWVEDIYHDSYQGAPTDGSAWTDGEGQDSSRSRVYRGGSWNSLSRILRSADRVRNGPVRSDVRGFRVARTLC